MACNVGYGDLPSVSQVQEANEWPTYRQNPRRDGKSQSDVPVKMKTQWKASLESPLSSPVMAEGQVFVASVDAHTVNALNATSGERNWSFTAGGRVDSPPTIDNGHLLFGSADGWVYCLRAADGGLVWRFRAAPEER